MLSPLGKMSPFQAAQIYTLWDPNIHNIAINGNFDDCQSLVKMVNQDGDFKRKFHIGSVNSINWARIAAQVVYYFKGYFAATSNSGQEVDFAVPTGNFGDILAGYVAKQMGLPIRRLILATNENNVLDEFFKTGVYRNTEAVSTTSPSMDISVASNFERFLYDVLGRDPKLTRQYMEQFEKERVIDLSKTPYFENVRNSGIISGSSTHDDRIGTIRRVYEKYGRIIDPHTADGVNIGLQYKEKGIPLICLETAKPTKFEDTIKEALGFVPKRPEQYKGLEQNKPRVELMDVDVHALKGYISGRALRYN